MTEVGYSVTLLRQGSYTRSPDGSSLRTCNTILLRGPSGSIIVNPGSVWNTQSLVSLLKSAGIESPEKEITHVICTDGRAEHVGCMSLFEGAAMMIVGFDIQKRGDIFVEHDFGDGIAPYEFDEYLYVIGTPGQRGHQVSLMVRGWITNDDQADNQKLGQIAITGNLFTDRTDASRVSFFDALEGNHGDSLGDKENSINCWRRSRQYVLDRADWIIPEYGEAFKVQPEYSSTPCVELA
ncbi:Metallo-beta-lactamase domain-containing protein 1 [Paragonimus heterotremus]|uniref:Metallo-beta-lactamase domain-containing protein 1 n=1 Tax=Paragonimus heterotremus TaxID=100268 RepID=A0A8J4WGZ0_9TREM|nr:Metallo-beta-lactamase domain-containing protein 1 [Paragonimus heterotremus]